MPNKSYMEITTSCKLLDYSQKLVADQFVWEEVWQDADCKWVCMFRDASLLPFTIYKHDN